MYKRNQIECLDLAYFPIATLESERQNAFLYDKIEYYMKTSMNT